MQRPSEISLTSCIHNKCSLLSNVALCLLGLSVLSTGCKSELDNKPKATVTDVKADVAKTDQAKNEKSGAKSLPLDSGASKVEFVGAKVTGDHKGEFKKISGTASLEKDNVTSFEVKVETTSVQSDDDKLTAHLKSPDFFEVEKFPNAIFKSTKIEAKPDGESTHLITGNLELHGQTKSISFPATISIKDNKAKGTADFKINRKDFGIEYPGRPDDLIKDEVLLKLDLSFS